MTRWRASLPATMAVSTRTMTALATRATTARSRSSPTPFSYDGTPGAWHVNFADPQLFGRRRRRTARAGRAAMRRASGARIDARGAATPRACPRAPPIDDGRRRRSSSRALSAGALHHARTGARTASYGNAFARAPRMTLRARRARDRSGDAHEPCRDGRPRGMDTRPLHGASARSILDDRVHGLRGGDRREARRGPARRPRSAPATGAAARSAATGAACRRCS